jgi:hypothetical protein
MWNAWRNKKCNNFLVGKPKGRRLLERRRLRSEYISKTSVKEAGYKDVNCIEMPHDRFSSRTL